MIIENIQQLLEHIETDKKAEELLDYINNLQIENKRLKDYEERFKVIKKIVEDNIFEDLDNLSYCMMLSTISSVCDGKTGFLEILGGKDENN